MTQSSIREYVGAVRERYFLASKKEKGKILDEFPKVTGRHRKAAIRLIRHSARSRTGKKRGRPQQYGAAVVGALRLVWEATDRLLRPWRRVGGQRPFSATKPSSLLKSSIPIRTFADWQEDRPGFLDVDLVPHCGESTEGF